MEERFNAQLFKISEGQHREKNVIWLAFDYDPDLVAMVKKHTKAKWSQSEKKWYLTDNPFNRRLCNLPVPIIGKAAMMKISETNLPEFEKYQKILTLKGYSDSTIHTYSIEFAQLLYLLKDYPVKKLTPTRLQSYFLYCTKELKLSENQIHSRMNAVKFYYEQVLHQPKMFFDIPRPKKPKRLPKTLNKKEVQKLFEVTSNLKHQLILKLCYGMGLRVSEIVNLKIEDIDSENMQVLVSRGKGKKDRYVTLPESILTDLRKYYTGFKPTEYLFEGQYGGAYSKRSAQAVFKNAMKKAGIRKQVGIHGLRHSYATHLLEMGTDISLIQKLLGHQDVKTTLLYTEITDKSLRNVRSPLDHLDTS